MNRAPIIISAYPNDVEDSLSNEPFQFAKLLKTAAIYSLQHTSQSLELHLYKL